MELARPGAPAPDHAHAGTARLALRLALAPLALALGACAALIDRPVNQEVQITPMIAGAQTEAACEVSNDRGRWTVIAPVSVGVTRSAEPLSVACVDADGRQGKHVAKPTRASAAAMSGPVGYDYPATVAFELDIAAPPSGQSTVTVASKPFAAIDDIARVPTVDAGGREGYRRFLAGPSPRAFAVAENGYWVRVNGSRGADRLAIDRGQTAGAACKLYAVDDAVVWDKLRAPELLAAQ
jgi:hypothetical protein